MEWDVYKNGKWIGTVMAGDDEDVARAAALTKYRFNCDDELSVAQR